MSVPYQHHALAELRPGMILFDELLDGQGHILLPHGTVLTAATIAQLSRHGIESVTVQVAAGAVAESEADQAAIALRLAHLFRKNDIDDQNDWATGILRRYVEDYRLQHGVEE